MEKYITRIFWSSNKNMDKVGTRLHNQEKLLLQEEYTKMVYIIVQAWNNVKSDTY